MVFKTTFWASSAPLAMTEAWDCSLMNYFNRSSEQVLYANVLGVLVPSRALHQFAGFWILHAGAKLWQDDDELIARRDPICEKLGGAGQPLGYSPEQSAAVRAVDATYASAAAQARDAAHKRQKASQRGKDTIALAMSLSKNQAAAHSAAVQRYFDLEAVRRQVWDEYLLPTLVDRLHTYVPTAHAKADRQLSPMESAPLSRVRGDNAGNMSNITDQSSSSSAGELHALTHQWGYWISIYNGDAPDTFFRYSSSAGSGGPDSGPGPFNNPMFGPAHVHVRHDDAYTEEFITKGVDREGRARGCPCLTADPFLIHVARGTREQGNGQRRRTTGADGMEDGMKGGGREGAGGGGQWYLFFEVIFGQKGDGEGPSTCDGDGQIGYAIDVSADGSMSEWRYGGLVATDVLRGHTAYPYVFESEGGFWMVPVRIQDSSLA